MNSKATVLEVLKQQQTKFDAEARRHAVADWMNACAGLERQLEEWLTAPEVGPLLAVRPAHRLVVEPIYGTYTVPELTALTPLGYEVTMRPKGLLGADADGEVELRGPFETRVIRRPSPPRREDEQVEWEIESRGDDSGFVPLSEDAFWGVFNELVN